MYRPTLKRGTIEQLPRHQNHPHEQLNRHQPPRSMPQEESTRPFVPSKLLAPPQLKNIDRKLVTPLLATSHTYPPSVSAVLEQKSSPCSRGVGAYNEVNWLFQGKTLYLWNEGEQEVSEQQFEEGINCCTVSELYAATVPIRFKNKYILAVACLNTITLFTLEGYCLRMTPTFTTFKVSLCLQVERMKWVNQGELLVATDTGLVQLISLCHDQLTIRKVSVPLYRRLLPPTVLMSTPKHVLNMVQSAHTVYVLIEEVIHKGWLASKLDLLFSEAIRPYTRKCYVEVFSIGEKQIVYQYRIMEEQVGARLRNYGFRPKEEVEISNIYEAEQGCLGLVLRQGYFVSLRNASSVFFGREPLTLPDTRQLRVSSVLCTYEMKQSAQPLPSGSPTESQTMPTILSSLGYSNLTLTTEGLFWLSDTRVDAIRCECLLGEIEQRRWSAHQSSIDASHEWVVFTRNNYYVVKQMPFRHSIAAVLQYSQVKNNQLSDSHSQSSSITAFFTRMQQLLTQPVLLKSLIEILVSRERIIAVNSDIIEGFDSEVAGDGMVEFRGWRHELRAGLTRSEMVVNELILGKVWNQLLSLQYAKTTFMEQSKASETAFWQSIHMLYHELMASVLKMNPSDMSKNYRLVENTLDKLSALADFFRTKSEHQVKIRERALLKMNQEKKFLESQSSMLDITRSSDIGDDMEWVEQDAREAVMSETITHSHSAIEDRLASALSVTAHLVKILMSLCEYPKSLPRLIDVLTSQNSQAVLKAALIDKCDYPTLMSVSQTVPQLGLASDLAFMRWKKSFDLSQKSLDRIDLKDLAEVVSSSYFKDCEEIFKERIDLLVRMLQHYEDTLLQRKESLAKSHTLRQRSLLINSPFPQDQQQNLESKRSNIAQELSKCLQEQKLCLSQAVTLYAQQQTQPGEWTIQELMRTASNKPSLYDHLKWCLDQAALVRESSQLDKMEYRSLHRSAYNKKIAPEVPRMRQLFPDPPSQRS